MLLNSEEAREKLYNYVKDNTKNIEVSLVNKKFIDIKAEDFGTCLELPAYKYLSDRVMREYLNKLLYMIAYWKYHK